MSLHVILLYPHGAQERGSTGSVYGLCCCRAVSAAVRPLCAVGLSGSCQAVTLGPDSDGTPRLSDSAVRLSDTCCLTVRESADSAVGLSGTVRRCPGFAVRLSDQGSDRPRKVLTHAEVLTRDLSRRHTDTALFTSICLLRWEPVGPFLVATQETVFARGFQYWGCRVRTSAL